jgi:hypothetical protein
MCPEKQYLPQEQKKSSREREREREEFAPVIQDDSQKPHDVELWTQSIIYSLMVRSFALLQWLPFL